MKIVNGTSLLTTVILLLDFVDIMRSEPSSLKDLFLRYNGILPPVEEFWFDGQLEKFRKFGDKRLIYISTFLVKRGHIIFGGLWLTFVHDLYHLFDPVEPKYFVFDMIRDEWVTVSHDLSRKLGATSYLPLLVARDEVAARHVTTSNNPIYKEAHIKACKQANDRVDIVEGEQVQLLQGHQTNMTNIIIKMKEEYSQTYNRAFTRHSHQRGEYNIKGQREMHT